MNKVIKSIVVIVAGLAVLIVVLLVTIPMIINVEKYTPVIEKKVSEITGRSFKVGKDLKLTLFPVAALSFSDLHFGNPEGFKKQEFVAVKSFDVEIKIIPFIFSLFKDLRITRFILKEPRIVLIKNEKGKFNWEGIGKTAKDTGPVHPDDKKDITEDKTQHEFSLSSFSAGEFSIKDGSVVLIDETKKERKEISGLNLRLKDLSLDRPIGIFFSAEMDGSPLSIEGYVGPVGKAMGKGEIPVDLFIKAFRQLGITFKGSVTDAVGDPLIDMAIHVMAFSPGKLAEAIGVQLPFKTTDPGVLNTVSFKALIKGGKNFLSVADGSLRVDDSNMEFTVKAKDFSKPDLSFNFKLDKIDLDRYMPAKSGDKGEKSAKTSRPLNLEEQKIDYTPIRNLILDGNFKIGELKIANAEITDIDLKVSGKNGIIKIDPLTLNMYNGDVTIIGSVDAKNEILKSSIKLQARKIMMGKFLYDILGKDLLEGLCNTTIELGANGDNPESIKKTLNGKGTFLLTDGAVKGIDLKEMIHNTKAAFLQALGGKEQPKTDFGEIHSTFNIIKGVINTSNTALVSPYIKVAAQGKADLIKESLNFRIEPLNIKAGEEKEKKGFEYLVPVLVTGSFSSPEFRPDLKKIINKELEEKVFESSEFKKIFKDDDLKPLEDTAKDLIKGLLN